MLVVGLGWELFLPGKHFRLLIHFQVESHTHIDNSMESTCHMEVTRHEVLYP